MEHGASLPDRRLQAIGWAAAHLMATAFNHHAFSKSGMK
jgi:hypothetical protein